LNYIDFNQHVGYKSIAVSENFGIKVSVKTNGYIADFGLQKSNGQIVYWKIPTGQSSFAFWNITKNLDIIARQYLIDCKKITLP